jgi:hypothetical protein
MRHKAHQIRSTTIARRKVTVSSGAPIPWIHCPSILITNIAPTSSEKIVKVCFHCGQRCHFALQYPIDANDRPHRTRNATIVKKRGTLLMRDPIHVHVLPFHHQQRQHPIIKEVLRQSKRPHCVSIMDRLIILPIDSVTYVNYRPQPKATRIWHELQPTRSDTNMDKRVTLLMSVPINNTTLM